MEDQYLDLLVSYLSGELSDSEQQSIRTAMVQDASAKESFDLVQRIYALSPKKEAVFSAVRAWETVAQALSQ
ncbi:MAG: hypothetical protein D6772_05665 [Bacteroidetes bacterium]|nr:MAG: hypothetical protein D6772_05665 [Bacteroidota bacterium]